MQPSKVIQIAWKGLTKNKLRSLLTMLGVIIGVAAVIIMIAISAGTEATIEEQITSLGSNLIFVSQSFQRMGFGPGQRAEESGGLGIKGHLPERDGVFIGLLMAEMMAARKMKLSELVEEVMKEFGWHYFNRYDAHLTEKEKIRIMKAYKKGVKQLAGFPVLRVETTDGFKLFVENGWVLVRASGTEPLIRFYAEAETPEKVEALLSAARAI